MEVSSFKSYERGTVTHTNTHGREITRRIPCFMKHEWKYITKNWSTQNFEIFSLPSICLT